MCTRAMRKIVDDTLVAAADRLADEHRAEAGRCVHPRCGTESYPCPAARASDYARRAAVTTWAQIWTARHDLASVAATYAIRGAA